MINDAMFRRNGKAGYVLKPQALREAAKDLLIHRTKHCLKVQVISAQQLPRSKDSQGREILDKIFDKGIMDPYVEVSLLVPDWTHSPFLPSESDAKYTPASGPQAGGATSARVVSNKTKSIKNNGFNPVWDESFLLPFDCVGDMKDLVFLKFAVRVEGQDSDEPLAQYVTSLACLRQGTFLGFGDTAKSIILPFGFQVIVTFPCMTHNCRNSCSRPCLSTLNSSKSNPSLSHRPYSCIVQCFSSSSSNTQYVFVLFTVKLVFSPLLIPTHPFISHSSTHNAFFDHF